MSSLALRIRQPGDKVRRVVQAGVVVRGAAAGAGRHTRSIREVRLAQRRLHPLHRRDLLRVGACGHTFDSDPALAAASLVAQAADVSS